MATATYGASPPTEADERTTLIQKKRPRRRSVAAVAAAAALVLCGTAVKVRRGSIEYRLGSDVGELGEYPTTTWEAVNNDQVETVYDLEEHVLVVTQVNEAYVLGNVCGSKDLGASEGALCFDEACALPTAAAFSCKAVEEP